MVASCCSFLAASNSFIIVLKLLKCFCITKQNLENLYQKMSQFQSLTQALNINVPMHAPTNLSSPLVKLILPLELPFLTTVWLPYSQLWATVIKEKTLIIQGYSLSNTNCSWSPGPPEHVMLFIIFWMQHLET